MLGKNFLFEQAETLVHFSYKASNEILLLVDLERADYKLYDPDIVTIETSVEAPSAKEFFILAILEKSD